MRGRHSGFPSSSGKAPRSLARTGIPLASASIGIRAKDSRQGGVSERHCSTWRGSSPGEQVQSSRRRNRMATALTPATIPPELMLELQERASALPEA